MNKQQGIRRLLYFVLLVAGLFFLKYFEKPNIQDNNNGVDTLTEAFRTLPVRYTKHAQCRMECRFIDKEEILDILENGQINTKKSDLQDLPCPSYALEGTTKDNQEVRIVFADCGNEVRVITAIDLGVDHECYCK